MTTIVNDNGFSLDDWGPEILDWSSVDTSAIDPGVAIDVPNTLESEDLASILDQVALIRIPFPTHVDGRGFTLARRLRLLGYKGRLRAFGHILADQYAKARRCGFDEVEIHDELAKRQPESQWSLGDDWRRLDYQERLRHQWC